MIKIWLLLACLALAGIAAAEDDTSSAQLVQFAVSMMGDTSQDAQVSDFNVADSSQIGYSSDGNVMQTVSYDNIGNGSILQWGESGDMPREERTLLMSNVGDSGFTWQWNKGDVNQTIDVRNSQNLYLMQIIGGLKSILFPDPQAPPTVDMGNWWFCGKAANGIGGLPLCAEKYAKKILQGKDTPRDHYMLQILEEYYYVFPPENLTPRVTLTKWNISKVNGNLTIKFRAHNYGKNTYNATLMLDMTPKININNLERNEEKIQAVGDGVIEFRAEDGLNEEIKMPEKQSIELGRYLVHSMKEIEKEVVVPLNGIEVKNLRMRMISE